MRTLRFYLPVDLSSYKEAMLDERCKRHATQVLRLKEGANITLFNGQGGEYEAQITHISKRQVMVNIGQFHPLDKESPLPVNLALGIVRGERMDMAIQKAVELGVHQIFPLQTERSVVQLDDKRAEKRYTHWSGVIQSACEQCGRNRLPELAGIMSLEEWLNTAPSGLCLSLNPNSQQTLQDFSHQQQSAPVTLLIGPEGGLSEAELVQAGKKGFQGIRLGPRILRTETAVISSICLLQDKWGDLADTSNLV